MRFLFEKAAILGVGLIGGALGMVMKKKRVVKEVIGVGKDPSQLELAIDREAIDRYEKDPRKAVEDADLVILATPVMSFEPLTALILPHLKQDAVVTDVGSVKAGIVDRLDRIVEKRARFVGGHPIAGSERSGVEAATAELFKGSLCVITPTPHTHLDAIEAVKSLWEEAGCRVILMEAATHDRILAAVSHLPHLTAYALVNAVLEAQVKNHDPLQFAGGGFRDFTRIAASSPEMWRDICLSNRDQILSMMEAYENVWGRLKQLIEKGDGPGLKREFERARGVKTRSAS
jgi:prephenate dehydrogenase